MILVWANPRILPIIKDNNELISNRFLILDFKLSVISIKGILNELISSIKPIWVYNSNNNNNIEIAQDVVSELT